MKKILRMKEDETLQVKTYRVRCNELFEIVIEADSEEDALNIAFDTIKFERLIKIKEVSG